MNSRTKSARKRIIIAVDDNPAFAEILRAYLEEQNIYQLLPMSFGTSLRVPGYRVFI